MFLILRPILLLLVVLLLVSALLAYLYVRNRNTVKKRKYGELPSDAGVRQLLVEGRYEEALELYQRFTGADSFAAQQALTQMEREIRLSNGLEAEISRLLAEENKAAAIEAYQQATDATLAEALEVVEHIERRR